MVHVDVYLNSFTFQHCIDVNEVLIFNGNLKKKHNAKNVSSEEDTKLSFFFASLILCQKIKFFDKNDAIFYLQNSAQKITLRQY